MFFKDQKGREEEDNDGGNGKDTMISQWTFLQDILLPSDALSADVCIQTMGNHKSIYVAYEISSLVSICHLCVNFSLLAKALQGEGDMIYETDTMAKLEKISKDFYFHDSITGTTSKVNRRYSLMCYERTHVRTYVCVY